MKKFKIGDKVKGINCLNVAFENGVVAGIDYPSAFEVEVDTEYGPGQWCTHEDLTLIEEPKLSIMEQAIEQYKELHNITGTRPFYADGIQFRFKGTDLEYLEPPTWSEFLTVSLDMISVTVIDERKFEKAYASTLCKLLFNEYKFSHLKGEKKNEII